MLKASQPARESAPGGASSAVWRLRAAAVCVALTALAFLQEPGKIVMDTKIDLATNPVGWLERSLHVWNPAGSFGQLQNQTYGYLWPMGPFFAAGDAVGMPAWVVQRLWWALLMCVACVGVMQLAERLAIGTPAARIIAGVAFALSPRMITELGPISVEAWPSAVAPWVLVPLVGLAHGSSLRRAVAWSALAVACAGGVNATAVLAVVPLAVLWLATLRPMRRRLVAIGAWGVAVAAATAWWLVPLLVLGRYSPPFLDYIETAPVTTRVTDLTTTMRGASHWLAYGRSWDAGAQLALDGPLIIATIVVAALGLAGLARRGMPHRRFLVTGLLVGVALVGMGHVAAVDGLFAESQRSFLDGAGAPLRNVHKFDVVLRLPLILGMAHLLGVLARTAAVAGRRWHSARKRAIVVKVVALTGIAAIASPALAGQLPIKGSFDSVPGYWQAAGSWLDANLGRDRVLVAPAARFPNYRWGGPADEITQPLLKSSWAVRNSIPLTPPTTIRLLDAFESVLATGAGSDGLTDLLARSGVRYVLLRSDLNYGESRAARPVQVRQALARSPGLRLVAAFGPMVGGGQAFGGYRDQGLDVPTRALEVYEVQQVVQPVVAYDATAISTVVGGPESLLDIAAARRLNGAPTVLAGDLPKGQALGPVLLTDGMRRREVTFGLLHDNASATTEAGQRSLLSGVARDYLPPWGDEYSTVTRYVGINGVTASSSWAQPHPLTGSRPAHHPFAAVDGDPSTSWRTAPSAPTRQWLEVELAKPMKISEVRLRFDTEADVLPTKVTVRSGAERVTVDSFDPTLTVRLPGVHSSTRIRVTIESALPVRTGQGRVGIAELEIPGVQASRTLVTPQGPATTQPATVVLASAPTTDSCFFVDDVPRCGSGVGRASEDGDQLDRTVVLPAGASYTPAVWARPKAGPQLNALLDAQVAKSWPLTLAPRVTASSTAVPDPVARPGAVLDGDPATAWLPASEDEGPWLKLNWLTTRTINGLRLSSADSVARARPWRVTVIGDGGVRGGTVGKDGLLKFDRPLRTDEVTILFRASAAVKSFDPYKGRSEWLPLGIGDVSTLPAGPSIAVNLDERVTLPCGSGPTLQVAGKQMRTAVTASRRELLELREVRATACGEKVSKPLELPAGELRVVASGSDLTTPTRLALDPAGRTGPIATPSPVRIVDWSATERRLHVAANPGGTVLAVRENKNPGWQATVAGQKLTPITVDGWQQGWLLPPGLGGDVVLRFTPDQTYRGGLVAGAVLLGVVLLLAVLPTRRPPRPLAAVPGRRRREWLLPGVVGAAALLTVGGIWAVVLATVGALALAALGLITPFLHRSELRRLRRVSRLVAWLLPVLCFGVAGWISLVDPLQHTSAAPQLAALAALTALWCSVALPARRLAVADPQRSTGRSTT
ncbi:arabinofuranan 3-O-arabinosyltransferase [Micromonospora coriariae]|uniref:Arabinofuranan 3-O-arabinosyltransferase n=1 Tax=Micromonospora coriariae TaxID=285665 RepID=A0A1C4VWK4_9ACTN|nr:alpha-(1->3)-arabinofuranosyltransferase [Micromonospora coriariae]SCE88394.1 arabinofuranan 3-O-arabinosyltransferase [Micromonospora coriariae]